MAQTIATADLPFAMIDGLGFFTVFNVEADAARIADGLVSQYANDGLTETEFTVSQRADGKFLVTAIETADEVCWHVPASMLAA